MRCIFSIHRFSRLFHDKLINLSASAAAAADASAAASDRQNNDRKRYRPPGGPSLVRLLTAAAAGDINTSGTHCTRLLTENYDLHFSGAAQPLLAYLRRPADNPPSSAHGVVVTAVSDAADLCSSRSGDGGGGTSAARPR